MKQLGFVYYTDLIGQLLKIECLIKFLNIFRYKLYIYDRFIDVI